MNVLKQRCNQEKSNILSNNAITLEQILVSSFKKLNIRLPREIGKVDYISKFSPSFLKKYYLLLKALYLVTAIGLILFLIYHLQYNDNNMQANTYFLILVVSVFGIYLLFIEFLTPYSIKIVGDKGVLIYRYFFNLKSPKQTLILFKNLQKIDIYEGGGRWIVGEERYRTYHFIQNENIIYRIKIYFYDKDNNAFIDRVLGMF